MEYELDSDLKRVVEEALNEAEEDNFDDFFRIVEESVRTYEGMCDVFQFTLNAVPDLMKLISKIPCGAFYRIRKDNFKLYIPENIKIIGECAFCESTIEEVVFLETLDRIEEYAFEKCSKLTGTLSIPDNTFIYSNAFKGCSLTNFIISDYMYNRGTSIERLGFGEINKEILDNYPGRPKHIFEMEDGTIIQVRK